MITKMASVAVFCGASLGGSPIWADSAAELGRGLGRAGVRLIYGGGSVGLMGAVADAALQAGGEVLGIIPGFLQQREIAHPALTALEVTETMHARKWRMFELAEAFVSFAGGLGTLDETFEILTWRQLGLHAKPIIVCNVAGSADALLGAIEAAIAMGFAKPDIRGLYEVVDGVANLLERITGVEQS